MNNTNNSRGKNRLQPALAAFCLLALLSWGGAEAAELRFIYANDNLGELDGCG